MSGIVTHHMFGVDIYGSCPELIGETQEVLPLFAQSSFSLDACKALTANINFVSRPVE